VAACSSLPTSGPTASDVKHQETRESEVRFDLVDIDDHVVAALLAVSHESFQARFKKYGKPPQPKIGVGDAIVVSIWEAAGGGLFGASATEHVSAGSRNVTIPQQLDGQDGGISIPFAACAPAVVRLRDDVQCKLAIPLRE